MKRFNQITKWIAIFFIMLLVSVFVVEIYRIKDATNTMYTYMKLANNYALTASQDISNLNDLESSDVKTTAGGTVIDMYEVTEYKNFLIALENAAYAHGGNEFLTSVHGVLKADYDRAVEEYKSSKGSPPAGSAYIDSYLQYTPLSFNIPYISYNAYVKLYSDSLGEMVGDYTTLGKPAIFIGKEDEPALTSDEVGLVSYKPNMLFTNVEGDSYNKVTTDNVYGYADSHNHTTYFKVSNMTTADIKRIYGNENSYQEACNLLAEITKSAKYHDIRFSSNLNSDMKLIYYDVNVKTDWYYITHSNVLRFFDGDKALGLDAGFTSTEFLNSLRGVAVFGSIESNSDVVYDNTGDLINGQLMLILHMNRDSWNSLRGIVKRYDIIN